MMRSMQGRPRLLPETSHGSLILNDINPRGIRKRTSLAAVSPGEYFDARFDVEEDAIVFRRLSQPGKEDWLAFLKQCPVSMGDIPSRRPERPRRRKL